MVRHYRDYQFAKNWNLNFTLVGVVAWTVTLEAAGETFKSMKEA